MNSSKKLFEEDSDEDLVLKTENTYAKKYDSWREKEELHKLEQKYGSKSLSSDASPSSDSEDESEEPLEVSEEMEKQFLKTLALLKTKDERIYDPSYSFFDEDTKEIEEKKGVKKSISFMESDSDGERSSEEDGQIFSVERKGRPGDDRQGKLSSAPQSESTQGGGSVSPLRALWAGSGLSEEDAFLRDYVLNKRYLEPEEPPGDLGDLSEDERQVEEQGEFERNYNFRFEEPDHEYLKRFPRTMNYVRPKDERRARKRAELRARKDEEKRRRAEEVARLRALRLKEVRERIEKIKEVTGNEELAFQEEDVSGEFDPEQHDRRMAALFDEKYYGLEADRTKPVFPELDRDLEIENWERYEGEEGEGQVEGEEEEQAAPHCEDDDFNMDADYSPAKSRASLLEEIKGGLEKKRRNRKRKSKLALLLAERKPKFVPGPDLAGGSYARHMEQYYGIESEDVLAGDLPTRFKYRQVVPNDYGLTVEEILVADDRELTQWAPLKKILKIRDPAAERGDVATYERRAADLALKRKMLPSLFRDLPREPEIVVPLDTKTKKKKKNKQCTAETVTESANTGADLQTLTQHLKEDKEPSPNHKQKEKKKKQKEGTAHSIIDIKNTNGGVSPEEVTVKKKKRESKGFIVEEVQTTGVGPSGATGVEGGDIETGHIRNKKNLKHKKKGQNKSKINRNRVKRLGAVSDSRGRVSDSRLRAFGLNPRRYRGFLKYHPTISNTT